ncbi:TIGR01906 family membrane protein [Arthrobacter sp. SF27]|nr:TIGR01906 family membrane protein [Arthrobacter sp. SF27]
MRKASRLPDLSAFNKEPRGTAKNNDGGAPAAKSDGGATNGKSDGGVPAAKSDGGAPAASRFKPDAVPGWGSPAPKPTTSAQADVSANPDQPGTDRPAPAEARTDSASTEATTAKAAPTAATPTGSEGPTSEAASTASPDSSELPSTGRRAAAGGPEGDAKSSTEPQKDAQVPSGSTPGPNPGPNAGANAGNPGPDRAPEWQPGPDETVRAEKTRARPGDKGAGKTSAAAATASSAAVGGAKGGAGNGSGAKPGAAKPNRPVLSDVERRAAEREEAVNAKPPAGRILQVMLAVFFPFLLIIGAIRAVCTPLFLWIEYHRPGFPADSFGFSTEDRMTYGSYTVDYLLNWAGPRYLGGLVGPDGEQLFLDSEVGHMADVKTVIMGAWIAGAVMLVLAVLAVIYLARTYPGGIRRGLFAGSAATLILIIVLGVLGALNWQGFFTAFHGVFFADGTWTFFVDDTLIRLFPAQFWMDAGIVIAVLVLMVSSLVLAFTWPTKSRRERSSEKLAAARARYLQDLREGF